MNARPCLAELLGALPTLAPAQAELRLTGLTLDSRQVVSGGGFVALAGVSSHGLQHLAQARARGAACILFEPPLPSDIAPAEDLLAVPGLRARLGALAADFHGRPADALRLIGVTGTNGKTSTVQLLAQALSASALGPCGHIGTLGIGLGEWQQAGERTTPDVLAVHASIAELARRGAQAVAMEVSSHALDQGRVDALSFAVAVFTNLTHDHLDYHGDMQAYGEAKARLFLDPPPAAAVLNLDDAFGRSLSARIAPATATWTYSASGRDEARLRAHNIELSAAGLRFDLCEDGQCWPLHSALLGRFNVDNLMAVAASLRAFGLALEFVVQLLNRLTPVPGRMQRVDGPADSALVVVDYAHTPDALQQTLASLRAHAPARLICVFGCGGERDRAKRPLMAGLAEALADVVWVTDDNPRAEASAAIIAEILTGFVNPERVNVQPDRGQAIKQAIAAAKAGDIVLIAGKGHERYQEVAGCRRPFDDVEIAQRCLLERAA